MFDLYKDLIIDHGINPRNKYIMNECTKCASGFNYFCGDKFDLYVFLNDDIITDISFYGNGCSVSTASISLLTCNIKGKSVSYAESMFFYFINVIKNEKCMCYDNHYIDLNTLSIIRNYPARVKCATLAWHILSDALTFIKKV